MYHSHNHNINCFEMLGFFFHCFAIFKFFRDHFGSLFMRVQWCWSRGASRLASFLLEASWRPAPEALLLDLGFVRQYRNIIQRFILLAACIGRCLICSLCGSIRFWESLLLPILLVGLNPGTFVDRPILIHISTHPHLMGRNTGLPNNSRLQGWGQLITANSYWKKNIYIYDSKLD